MKLNALQRYLLEVYAIAILALTVFVPTLTSTGSITFNFILFGHVNISFLLTEYLALTLALVASLLAANDYKRK